MTLTEKLESYAVKHNIDIVGRPAGSSFASATLDGRYVIAMPAGYMTNAECAFRLGHELGHCETDSFYFKECMFMLWERCEYRAKKWEIKKLLPKSKIKAAVRRGCTEVWQIAEFVDLPPEFVEQAIFFHENGYIP